MTFLLTEKYNIINCFIKIEYFLITLNYNDQNLKVILLLNKQLEIFYKF